MAQYEMVPGFGESAQHAVILEYADHFHFNDDIDSNSCPAIMPMP